MVMHGYETTVPVPLELMIMHGRAVVRGAKRALVVVDMPFGSYEESPPVAFRNAARVMKETDCGAVKLEGGRRMAETIRYLVDRGIPVMAHIGLTPQSINMLGGFKAQGRTRTVGARSRTTRRRWPRPAPSRVVLEAIAEPLAAAHHRGGGDSDHRHRRLGRLRRPDPGHGGHARPVAARAEVRQGVRQGGRGDREGHRAYADEVRTRAFPAPEHTYAMKRAGP